MRGERPTSLVVPVPIDVLRAWCGERRTAGEGGESLDVLRTRLATRQEGVVSARQLHVLGLSDDQVAWRVKRSALVRLFRGVYAVGHEALTFRAGCIAALLAVGDDAALSHSTAAHLWTFLPTRPPFVDVTVPGRRPRSRPGLLVHSGDVEVARHEGLLMTTPRQTLHALRRHPRIASMTSEALYLALIEPATAPDDAPARSELERRMLRLIRQAGLEHPECQARIGPYTADFLWPAARLIAETDGWAAHRHELAFHRDRRRDAWLLARGYVVIRFTWPQLRDEPYTVVARLAAVLAHRGGTPHRVVPHPPPGG
jgi:very-short-patch-repair endonuclease